ncbi:MAG: peroxiredoxin-like family protein [Cetobacterium sp.]
MVNVLEKKLSERRESAKNRISPEILSKMLEATQSLKNSELEKEAFNIGDKIEDMILLNNLGDKVSIMEVLGKQPAIISFYRGTWCPYCNLELSTYNKLLKDKNKIKMIAISPERPESSINVENLNFEVLSDIDNKFAKKLNLTFDITETIESIYDGFGINLEKSQGKKSRILPIHATYIVDSSGVIVYAYIDADYTKRAEPKEVIDKYLELIK